MAHTWHEADHPRDPANGEFVDKQGWAGRVVTAMFGARRVQGRDIRTKLDYDQLKVGAEKAAETSGPGQYNDPALNEIVHAQGFDGPPEVVDEAEMDRRVQSGWKQMWRGLRPYMIQTGPNWSDTQFVDARHAAEQFRTGDYFAGKGVFGNGTYASVDDTEALGYGHPGDGGMLRIALNPEARVADFDELLRLGDKYKSAHWATGSMIRGLKTPPGSPQREAAVAVSDRLTNKTKVLADMGRLAAAMGYDAIAVQPRNSAHRDGRVMYYVILNRTAVAVQEAQ